MECMSWIDDRLAEREALLSRRENINTNAPKMYQALWAHLMELVKEANGKSFRLLTNGSEYERIIIMPTPPAPDESETERAELHLDLAEDKSSIGARPSRFDPQRTILSDIVDDGISNILESLACRQSSALVGSDSGDAVGTVMATLEQYGRGDLSAARQLASGAPSEVAFQEAVTRIVKSHFQVETWTLPA
jgi:hypothetical protein